MFFKLSSTTCIFHNVFIHTIMYSYSLPYLHQVDEKLRYRYNSTSCGHLRKEFDFRFRYASDFILCMHIIYVETCCY